MLYFFSFFLKTNWFYFQSLEIMNLYVILMCGHELVESVGYHQSIKLANASYTRAQSGRRTENWAQREREFTHTVMIFLNEW